MGARSSPMICWPLFEGRVLAFDLDASRAYADLMLVARDAGKAIGKADGYIAATAAAKGLMVATRNTSPFEAAGLNIINPWKPRHDRSLGRAIWLCEPPAIAGACVGFSRIRCSIG